jgi:polyisoprenoid-binding protein YceI
MTSKNCFATTVFVLLSACSVGTALAQAIPFEIRPAPDGSASSKMELTVEKTGLLSGKKHLFVFSKYQGAVHFDRDKPEASTVTFAIDSNSIVCKDTWLSAKDLKKVQGYALQDILAVGKYPQITFKSSKISKSGEDRYQVEGTLQIKGVAKPIVVDATVKNGSRDALAIEGNATIRLTDYGISPPKAALGTIGTKNEMPFHFVLTATSRGL